MQEFTSCLSWFFSVFYDKFFELCPESKELFTNVSIAAQGRLLAGIISSSFDILKNSERLERRLIKIVTRHNPMKIKAAYYGLMGEALLWTLHFILGLRYTDECALAWTKIYSFLLNIIIPRAVEYEYKLSLVTGGDGKGSVSQKSPGSEISTIRSSIRSMKSTMEERILNSVSLLRKCDGSTKKTAVMPFSSRTSTFEVPGSTEIGSFESVNVCPFARKGAIIDPATTVSAVPTSFYEKSGGSFCPHKKPTSPSSPIDVDIKPIRDEFDFRKCQYHVCPMDTTHRDRKFEMTDSQHKKALVTIDLLDSEDIKVPYFNHTGKCPIQPLGNATTDCVVTDICYDDFIVDKLNRYTDKNNQAKK